LKGTRVPGAGIRTAEIILPISSPIYHCDHIRRMCEDGIDLLGQYPDIGTILR
jgi:hypothetical protein